MLIAEAKWFHDKIQVLNNLRWNYPILDIGSSDDLNRRIKQPWIYKYIFQYLDSEHIFHLDIKETSGVNLVGNLTDRQFLLRLSKMKFGSVFCFNILEHIANKEEVCKILTKIVPVGGYLLVSCPYFYPQHLDPIDNMYRPDIKKLSLLFPRTKLVYSEIVTCGTFFNYITRTPLMLTKIIIRYLLPFYQFHKWLVLVKHIPWANRNFLVTCIILEKL